MVGDRPGSQFHSNNSNNPMNRNLVGAASEERMPTILSQSQRSSPEINDGGTSTNRNGAAMVEPEIDSGRSGEVDIIKRERSK